MDCLFCVVAYLQNVQFCLLFASFHKHQQHHVTMRRESVVIGNRGGNKSTQWHQVAPHIE